jgi:hypothetical protein
MGQRSKLGRIPPHPPVFRKSAEAIEPKRVPQHSLFQECSKSAEAIENKEFVFRSFAHKDNKRENKSRIAMPTALPVCVVTKGKDSHDGHFAKDRF